MIRSCEFLPDLAGSAALYNEMLMAEWAAAFPPTDEIGGFVAPDL